MAKAKQMERRLQSRPYCSPKQKKERIERLRRNYENCQSILDTPGERYLRSCGITMPLEFLDKKMMYNPSLYYNESSLDQPLKMHGLCSMVVCKDFKPLTMHRTLLDNAGRKSLLKNNRLMFSSIRTPIGGCIPLDEPIQTPIGRVIGVCEGLETGLSVRQATGCPMWIGVSDRMMEKINCLNVDVVLIWADKDHNKAGEEAAIRMQEYLEKQAVSAFIFIPKTSAEKADWNDILVEHGIGGFPQPLRPEWKIHVEEV